MIGRSLVIGGGLLLIAAAGVNADEIEDEIVQPPPVQRPAPPPAPVCNCPAPQPVTAAPPSFVDIQSASVGLGLGVQWGEGTLIYEGLRHGFSVRGVSAGDIGFAKAVSAGEVQNLERLEDFAGHYVAVEAGAAAGDGSSVVAMRNEHGVVIHLRPELEGVRLALGANGVRIALQ